MSATAYAAVNHYQMDDFRPYIYRTHDYRQDLDVGNERHSRQLPSCARCGRIRSSRNCCMRVLKAAFMFRSMMAIIGKACSSTCPIVPVTDLTAKGWRPHRLNARPRILDTGRCDPARTDDRGCRASTPLHVFQPRAAYRVGRAGVAAATADVIVDYYLAQTPSQPVTIEFQDGTGKTIKSFTSNASRERRGEGRGNRPQGGQAGRT